MNHSAGHRCFDADRCYTGLAPQPGMGLRPQWGCRIGVVDSACTISDGQDIVVLLNIPAASSRAVNLFF